MHSTYKLGEEATDKVVRKKGRAKACRDILSKQDLPSQIQVGRPAVGKLASPLSSSFLISIMGIIIVPTAYLLDEITQVNPKLL